MKKQLLLTLLLGFLFTACSTKTIALSQKDKRSFSTKTITMTHRDTPTQPQVMTPTKAIGMSGMVGFLDSLVLSSFDDGKGYKTSNIPSDYINAHLIDKLVTKDKMHYLENNITTEDDALDALVKHYPNSDYLLDTTTTYWTVIYFPTHWQTYKISMQNIIKLIDVKEQKVIAQKQCLYDPEYQEGLPSYDEMFANDALLIKEGTKKAMDYCVEEFFGLL